MRAGQVVAIVGLSGAGKTTLVNLVPRFYDVTAGAILIDGVDVRNVTLKSLRAQIGIELSRLRRARNKCDYDDVVNQLPKLTLRSLARAAQILANLGRL